MRESEHGPEESSVKELKPQTGEVLRSIAMVLSGWERKSLSRDETAKLSEIPEVRGFLEILTGLVESIPQQTDPLAKEARELLVDIVKTIPTTEGIFKKVSMDVSKVKRVLRILALSLERPTALRPVRVTG